MRPEVVVGAGVALLVASLAGVEWWAERQWSADAVVRPAVVPDPGLPEVREIDDPEAFASPRLSR